MGEIHQQKNAVADPDMFDVAILGYGSAGSGNRSLRRTATNAGVGTTAAERNRRKIAGVRPSQIGEPPKDELLRWISAGRCWWCGDSKVYKSLSGHWERGHGMDIQAIRDYLCLPKDYSFISQETKQKFAERGRKLYNPEKLKRVKGDPCKLSAFGLESQRRKAEKFRQSLGDDGLKQHMTRMRDSGRKTISRKAREARTEPHPCVICGKEARWPIGRAQRQTCSDECDRERRRRAGKRNAGLGVLVVGKRKPKFCKCCGKDLGITHRITCSDECAHKMRSEAAIKTAAWKIERAVAARRAKAAQTPKPLCKVPGCGRPHRCKHLCNAHYLQSRAGKLPDIQTISVTTVETQ